MNELTLNELISETEKCKRLAYFYFNKFIKKKYNFEFYCDDGDDYNEFSEDYCNFYIGRPYHNHVRINYRYNFGKSNVQVLLLTTKKYYTIYDTGGNTFDFNGTEIYEEYKNTIEFFTKPENVKEICSYAIRINKFLYDTTYIVSLPKAYTFLLSNKKNKIFPKEIAKLIVHKLLFFLPQKKIENEKENRMEKRIEEFWNSKTGKINDYVGRLVICEAKKFGVQFDKVDTILYVGWAGPEILPIFLVIDLICENKKINIDIEEICEDYLHNPTVMACRLEDIMEFSSNGTITFDNGCSYELGRLDWYKESMQSQLTQFSKPDALRAFLTDVPTMTKICETTYTVYSQFYLNYFSSLPKAYSFLLCNSKNKIFPKEIAKIIAYKILFFIFASDVFCFLLKNEIIIIIMYKNRRGAERPEVSGVLGQSPR